MSTRHVAAITTGIVAGALTLSACSATGEPSHDRPAAQPEQAVPLAAALNDAGFAIFAAAQEGDANLSLSPVSIGTAFGMLDAGASGEVKTALQELFRYPLDGDARLRAFNSLDLSVSSEAGDGGHNAWGEEVDLPVVRIANRIFVDESLSPHPTYIATVARYFGADAVEAPLRTNASKSRDMIDGWIKKRTEGLIPEIMPKNQPTADTQLVLANAVYFKAQWHSPFDSGATAEREFTLLDGSTISADAMAQTMTARSTVTDDYAAAILPYVGDMDMVILVPTEGSFADVAAQLSHEFLTDLDSHATEQPTLVQLPTFTTESSLDLREVIQDTMGIQGLFGVVGLDGIGPDLAVSAAIHATKVIVDEDGTEAAAATVIVAEATSAIIDQPEPVSVIADRPFLYLIRDTTTGSVLFVGRIMDPTAG